MYMTSHPFGRPDWSLDFYNAPVASFYERTRFLSPLYANYSRYGCIHMLLPHYSSRCRILTLLSSKLN